MLYKILIGAGLIGLAAWQAAPDFKSTWRVASSPPDQLQAREQSVYYRNCAAARAAGAAPIQAGEPGYRDELDADSDGVACEPYRY